MAHILYNILVDFFLLLIYYNTFFVYLSIELFDFVLIHFLIWIYFLFISVFIEIRYDSYYFRILFYVNYFFNLLTILPNEFKINISCIIVF